MCEHPYATRASPTREEAEMKNEATFLVVSDTDLENTWAGLQEFSRQQQKK